MSSALARPQHPPIAPARGSLTITDIDPALEAALVEDYSAEKDPDDGEFYCKVRRYQGRGGPANPFLERRWMARLEYVSKSRAKKARSRAPGAKIKPTKANNLRQILGNTLFMAEFDVQLDIPGLRSGMRLGVMHKVFSHCLDDVSRPRPAQRPCPTYAPPRPRRWLLIC